MGNINPIKLYGNWNEGYALDYHVVYSEYLGIDQWGYGQYNTKRTHIGQLLYNLKYGNDHSAVEEIVQLIVPFLIDWNIINKIDYIIPAPPSKVRILQLVYELCEGIGQYLNKQVRYDIIRKDSTIQSKNLDVTQKGGISGTIIRQEKFNRRVNLLIVDDLYQSGSTLTEIVKVLKDDPNINHIYVLTMTKTRR